MRVSHVVRLQCIYECRNPQTESRERPRSTPGRTRKGGANGVGRQTASSFFLEKIRHGGCFERRRVTTLSEDIKLAISKGCGARAIRKGCSSLGRMGGQGRGGEEAPERHEERKPSTVLGMTVRETLLKLALPAPQSSGNAAGRLTRRGRPAAVRQLWGLRGPGPLQEKNVLRHRAGLPAVKEPCTSPFWCKKNCLIRLRWS